MSPAALAAKDTPAPFDAGVIYWSSSTQNTHQFALSLHALGHQVLRLPNQGPWPLATRPFVLMAPTYADGEGRGAVPKPIIRFLNIPQNRAWLRGVIGGGNRNFGATYIYGAKEIARKCAVPIIADFELSGTPSEAQRAHAAITKILA